MGERRRRRRSWPRALGWGVAALYVPQLLPFVSGPLTECSHCIDAYGRLFPLVPGMLAARIVMLGPGAGGQALAWVAASLMSLALLVLAAVLARRASTFWLALLALLAAGNALAFSHVLRM